MVQDGNTKDFALEDIRLKFCVYGSPGSGKTWFAATMPNPYFIFHRVTEDGLLYYKMRGMDIEYVSFDTIADLTQILDSIESGQRAQGAQSIILDGWDRLDQPIIQSILGENGAKKMTRPMWGVARDRLKDLVNRFLNLGKFYHVAILAGDMLEKNELSGKVYGLPNTIGKFREEIGGLFDLFFYANQETWWDAGKQKVNYWINTVQFEDFKAKDRSGVLEFKEPNDFPLIFEKFIEKAKAIRKAVTDGDIDNEYLQEIPLAMRKLLALPQVIDPEPPEHDPEAQPEPVVKITAQGE